MPFFVTFQRSDCCPSTPPFAAEDALYLAQMFQADGEEGVEIVEWRSGNAWAVEAFAATLDGRAANDEAANDDQQAPFCWTSLVKDPSCCVCVWGGWG